MKTARYIIVSVLCSFLSVSCSQKSVPLPASSTSVALPGSSQITERSLESSSAASEIVPSKSDPQPIAKPILGNQADQQVGMTRSPDPLSLGFVNGRIIEYEQKLGRWQELDNQSMVMNIGEEQTEAMLRCYRELQSVLSGYQRMHDEKIQNYSAAANQSNAEKMETLRLDIAFLEGTCEGLLGGGQSIVAGWPQGQAGMELQQIEVLIDQSAAEKEYDEVINLWVQIPAYQINQAGPETRIHYANALMFMNQPDKAAEIYRQIVDDIAFAKKQPMDLLSLRKRLADLYTAAGNYPAAEGQYAQISTDYLTLGQFEEWSKQQLFLLQRSITDNPELDDYAGLLRAYLGFLPERDGFKIVRQAESFLQLYPYSPVSANVDIIKEDVQSRADQWFNTYMAQIDSYLAEKNYQEALNMIKAVSREILSEEDLQKITEKEGSIVLAEAVERETLKRDTLQDLQRRWNEGMSLAEQDDIDGALVLFTELLETEYGSRAEMKINELALEAAKTERRRAADYFVRFGKATNVETKKEMLIESRRILKDILKKYPDVEIAEKVSGNIKRVEKEMNGIDPVLLAEIEQEEQERALQEQQGLKQQIPEEEVDIFDLPLSSAPAPSAIINREPLPVIVPQDLQ